MCIEFSKSMSKEFVSIMSEVNVFLRLQNKQMENSIHLSQSKYYKEILKKFGFENVKPVSTPTTTNENLTAIKNGEISWYDL